jgi:hypothetical protein
VHNLESVALQQIRVDVRQGSGVPLVLCNGIGASLEVFDPLLAKLDPDTTIVRFYVPGTGGSPNSPLPYRFPYLAMVLGRLLRKLGFEDQVDILGLSWGRALAQQIALSEPASVTYDRRHRLDRPDRSGRTGRKPWSALMWKRTRGLNTPVQAWWTTGHRDYCDATVQSLGCVHIGGRADRQADDQDRRAVVIGLDSMMRGLKCGS